MTTSKTFGIDLAAQPKNTAGCLIEWDARGNGHVHRPSVCLGDHDLLAEMIRTGDVTRVAIDAPFGWPETFVSSIPASQRDGRWPDPPGSSTSQAALRLRMTDFAVKEATGLTPLSVSTDRIGVVAMRCARLLAGAQSELGTPIDRSGAGRFLEVYPAASLRQWELSTSVSEDPGSYKGRDPHARARRAWIVESLCRATAGWLEVGEETREVCIESDHCVDALIASLTARAGERDLLEPVGDPVAARTEGWIRIPRRSSLESFSPQTPSGV
jgi:hypothetical protein